VYLSLFWECKEATKRIGFGETVAVEGPGSDAQMSGFVSEISLLSNYPKRQRGSFFARGASPSMREIRIN